MNRTSKLSLLVAAIASFSLSLSGLALADTVKAGDVVTSGNVTKAAGSSGTARLWLLVNNKDKADAEGCNATTNDPVTVTLTSSHANVSLASTSVQITDCDDAKTDVVEGAATTAYSVASGAPTGAVYTISGTGSGGKNAVSHYDAGSFTVTVAPPSDSTAPSITPNVSGTLGNNGWYRSDVALTWTVTDTESTVSSSTGCGATNITADQNSTTYTCSATSAGGTASRSVSIKRDATAPSVQLSGGPSGSSYEGETAGAPTCTASDGTAGLASACAVSGYSTATGTHTATASATDNAGNTGTATGAAYTVLDDTSAPVITQTATGTKHSSGWFTSDVVLDWTATEGETPSSLNLTGCADKTINTDGTFTESCSATSFGGTASDSITIKRDATAPTVALAGLANNASFYEGEGPAASAITCSASDLTSGLADADGTTAGNQDCIISGYDGSTPGTRTLTATAHDQAGNVGTHTITYTVNDDTTPPTINKIVTGTAGDNGWFTSNVGIAWTVTESETPKSLTKTGCVDETISTDGTVSKNCSASSAGGGPASDSVTVKRDVALPTVSVTGLTDGGSYYEGEVPAAGCSASDATSQLADADSTAAGHQDCKLSAGTTQTPGQYQITSNAKDNAGNTNAATVSYTVLDDTTAPTVTKTVTGTLGTNNWYTSNVTVDWTVTENDTPTSLSSNCPRGSLTSDGTQTFSCSASSLGGGPVNDSVTVKRDATAPTNVQFSNYAATQYFSFVAAAPTCTADDATSGLKSCLVTGGGTAVGPQTWTATATDDAGNVQTATLNYTVSRWNTRGFFSPVDLNNTLNVVKGGSTVPLKFEVFAGVAPAGELTTTGAIGATLKYSAISCTTGTIDEVEVLASGSTALRYDEMAGQFIYNWKTPTGTQCYKVNVHLADGTTISALFKTR